MPKIQAFIARSFNEQDEINLKPILDFLRSFEILGFFCVHARTGLKWSQSQEGAAVDRQL